jgi:hypothetical protein
VRGVESVRKQEGVNKVIKDLLAKERSSFDDDVQVGKERRRMEGESLRAGEEKRQEAPHNALSLK